MANFINKVVEHDDMMSTIDYTPCATWIGRRIKVLTLFDMENVEVSWHFIG
jgi:hypothetical protein